MRITPENITELKSNEVFVFGSNLAGQHYGGAAKFAYEKLNYPWGVSMGLIGQARAIPTLNERFEKLSLTMINFYISLFYSRLKTDLFIKTKFYVTPIGCGIAGFTPNEIAPMFERFVNLRNVYLPKSFLKVIYKNKPWYDIKSKFNLLMLKIM